MKKDFKAKCRKCIEFEPIPFTTRGKCNNPFIDIKINVGLYPKNYDPDFITTHCNNFIEK